MRLHSSIAVTIFAAASSPAWAGYTITQGPTAPVYTTTLNFDEPGGPTGLVSTTDWLVSHGLTIDAGDGVPQVDDWDAVFPEQGGDGNSFYGNFGVFMTFTEDLDAMSIDIWDPAGPPSPFGGGLGVFVFDDGVEVASFFATPAWAGVGDPSFNIVADSGMVFDEVRILGFGFPNTTFADNLSWNVIPAPGSLALLIFAGATTRRRRRS